MKFIIAVIDDKGRSASGNEIEAIDAFNDKLQAGGHWIFACGIEAPDQSHVIDNRMDVGISSHGSLHDTVEFMSGFWLINAPDIETAKALAAEGSKACNRKVELRPLIG